ncbi:outer membrane beta-barrel protein [Tamlana fucoidanivorans]|uniref:Porin family protein n=1 Tax=Allotamlana fucoidanivorans TaxID=2583814 RepID=A0A5C4SG53_9FLAO|nr:porin family protein [Tamlana fucoidanivorans]
MQRHSVKLLFSFLLLTAFPSFLIAQEAQGFGLKGGLNYNANGNYFESIESSAEKPSANAGFHLGIFGKVGSKVFLKPELVYTSTKSRYDSGTLKLQKLDAPVLVGIDVIGPLSVFGGPSFQYIVDSDFNGITLGDIENDFTVGLNFGIGFNLNKVGIDLRYERGFNENEATFINNNIINTKSRIDTRPNQLILSLSLIL